jgi:hypothetical protein
MEFLHQLEHAQSFDTNPIFRCFTRPVTQQSAIALVGAAPAGDFLSSIRPRRTLLHRRDDLPWMFDTYPQLAR